MEEQGLAGQLTGQGNPQEEQMKQLLMQIIQLLQQGVRPEDLIQQGVPPELVQQAVDMLGQLSQAPQQQQTGGMMESTQEGLGLPQ